MKKKIVCLLLAMAMCFVQTTAVLAETEEELIEDQAWNSAQLDATYAQIDALWDARAQVQSRISETNVNLVNTYVAIDTNHADQQKKQEQIEVTEKALNAAIKAKDKQYEAMKKRIQYIYENGGSDAWFQMMMDAKNFSELLTKAENTQKMYSYDRAALDKYVETINQVTALEEQYKQELAELEAMEQELQGMSANLQAQIEELKAVSADYENEIAYAQSVAADLEAIIVQQQAQIEQLREERIAAEEAARAQAAQEAAQQAASYEEEGEPIVDYTYDEDGEIMYDEDGDPIYQIVGYENTATEISSQTEEVVDYARDEDGDIMYDEDGDPVYETYTVTASSEDTGSGEGSSSGSSGGSSVVDYATQFVGNPYVWGGTSLTNGADCSGFVQSVMKNFGISLPRTSRDQGNAGRGISSGEMRPGDLVFYTGSNGVINHVAMYIGNGQVVHASNKKTGIKISSWNYRTPARIRNVLGD